MARPRIKYGAGSEPVEECERGRALPLIWFDMLTMSGARELGSQ